MLCRTCSHSIITVMPQGEYFYCNATQPITVISDAVIECYQYYPFTTMVLSTLREIARVSRFAPKEEGK